MKTCERCGAPFTPHKRNMLRVRYCSKRCYFWEPMAERISKHSEPEPTSGCWLWTAAINYHGYGVLTVGPNRKKLAHRLSYETVYGPLAPNSQIDHLCRVRSCVNPRHLEAVDARTNQLRGFGPGGQNARKTHCPRGHAYDHVRVHHGRLVRECVTCRNEQARRRRVS